MTRSSSWCRGRRLLTAVAAVALVFGSGWMPGHARRAEADPAQNPNNLPVPNPGGHGATFSTEGFVDLVGEYFQAQGANGRSCGSCHIPEEAWAINPGTLQRLFDETGGTHPIFNPLDANNPEAADFSTVGGRWAAYSMMLSRGVFRRGGAPRAEREWDVVAVDDPHGFANLGRIVQWRRVMPTINFPLGSATVNWDGGNSIGADQLAGLTNQATRNVTGAQQGPPAPPEVIEDIVEFETSLFTAQIYSFSAGFLNADGARGGPEELADMAVFPGKTPGRFDLFDAWADSPIATRRQIFRGQEVFNNVNVPSGRRCGACHTSANNGTNINNTLFDIGTASAAARTPDLPLYTFRNRTTGEEKQLSDTGRGNVTGL
jgi:mono/diheme cytochrome c family protein